jgi:hypothetical protein
MYWLVEPTPWMGGLQEAELLRWLRTSLLARTLLTVITYLGEFFPPTCFFSLHAVFSCACSRG